ncbi:hypothetical protein [Priestia megaterium]|uniref:hypothetical protein n=1 Tax=Priestia megaterium TaxID=1404 RepID=UPI000BFE478A|nr:hypothetical protein [Priestia megaterium]PGQ88169.1 hypothetical protein COA18_04395 [Priestia megaterium]
MDRLSSFCLAAVALATFFTALYFTAHNERFFLGFIILAWVVTTIIHFFQSGPGEMAVAKTIIYLIIFASLYGFHEGLQAFITWTG